MHLLYSSFLQKDKGSHSFYYFFLETLLRFTLLKIVFVINFIFQKLSVILFLPKGFSFDDIAGL